MDFLSKRILFKIQNLKLACACLLSQKKESFIGSLAVPSRALMGSVFNIPRAQFPMFVISPAPLRRVPADSVPRVQSKPVRVAITDEPPFSAFVAAC